MLIGDDYPDQSARLGVLLWSIALPGFGQILNGRLFKGLIFVLLEIIINVGANLNRAIIESFHGKIELAIQITNYQWLMFYPCVYAFAIWDAYNDAKGERHPFAYLPFVSAAYLGTVGVVFSATFKLNGILIGPVWLPLLGMISGVAIGIWIMWGLTGRQKPGPLNK